MGGMFFLLDREGIVRGKWIGEDMAVFPNEPLLKRLPGNLPRCRRCAVLYYGSDEGKKHGKDQVRESIDKCGIGSRAGGVGNGPGHGDASPWYSCSLRQPWGSLH